jgi:hypothetical protein
MRPWYSLRSELSTQGTRGSDHSWGGVKSAELLHFEGPNSLEIYMWGCCSLGGALGTWRVGLSDLIGQMGSLRPRVGQGWPQVTHSHHSFTAGQPGVRSTNSLQLLAPKGISAFPTWDGSLHFADGHVDTPEDSCQWS